MLERIAYAGWPNCLKLGHRSLDLVATTDVGPRIIRLGRPDGPNLFKEYPDLVGLTGGDEWRIYGGHRLWHAPEVKPRTYAPDNGPIEHRWDQSTLTLIQPVEASTGVQKRMDIRLDPERDHVEVRHTLTNHNPWTIELASWSPTVMAPGGRAVYPHEPYVSHEEKVLPARPLVLWSYTDMSDPRWTWGRRFLQLRQDPAATTPQKVGFYNGQGWAAYLLHGQVFLKRYATPAARPYPDFGCNTETFTNADMLEVETNGPLDRVEPGASTGHTEHWFLFDGEAGDDEDSLAELLEPLVEATEVDRG